MERKVSRWTLLPFPTLAEVTRIDVDAPKSRSLRTVRVEAWFMFWVQPQPTTLPLCGSVSIV